MWKPYTVIILYFIKRIFLLPIFQTLFSENCCFLDNFDQNLFLVQKCKDTYKSGAKNDFKLIFCHFLSISLHYWTKNRFWSKLSKKGQFSLNKVRKMANKNIFSIKYEMITVYGFHIDFQFRGQLSLPRDIQMVMTSPWL